jgi:hypothetical protein
MSSLESHMFRFVLSAVALAGFLSMEHPASADPQAATAAESAPVSSSATEQHAPPSFARATSPDAPTPANAGRGKDIVPVGFGWG